MSGVEARENGCDADQETACLYAVEFCADMRNHDELMCLLAFGVVVFCYALAEILASVIAVGTWLQRLL